MNLVLSFTEIFGVLLLYNVLSARKVFDRINMNLLLAFFITIIYELLNMQLHFIEVPSLIVVCVIIAFTIIKIEKSDVYTVIIKLTISIMLISIDEIIAGALIQIIIGDRYYI